MKCICKPSVKYGQPIINKNVPEWNVSQKEKDKKIRRTIFQQKVAKTNLSSWKNSLYYDIISNDNIGKHMNSNKK